MNMSKVDLNLLVYLDVLLRECNVTRAAEELGISQALVKGDIGVGNDPILVRTSDGMTPTDRAMELKPMVRKVLSAAEQTILPKTKFEPEQSKRHLPYHGQRLYRVDAAASAASTVTQRSAGNSLRHHDSQ